MDKERAEFEKQMPFGLSMLRNSKHPDCYESPNTQWAWQGWQARASQPNTVTVDLSDEKVVERIAQAMFQSVQPYIEFNVDWKVKWDAIHDYGKKLYRTMAKAALAALINKKKY